jgi:Pyridoxamine 5'-phosphate oxidase
MSKKKSASGSAAKPPIATRPNMPGYGLPKDRKGLLPWKWAKTRLEKSKQYWIATVRPDGAPHVMVVWGLWWDDTFCFSTGSDSRKTRNLDANPRCVISNEDAMEAVIVEGAAKRLRDVPRIRKFLAIYSKKYRFDMSGMADEMVSLREPVFIVRPQKVFGQPHDSFAQKATRWIFPK